MVRSLKEKTYNCAKFLGLPDMTRAVVPNSPTTLEIEIDVNRGKRHLYQAIYGLGRHLNRNPLRVREAATAAWEALINYRRLMSESGLTPLQAVQGTTGMPRREPDGPSADPEGPAPTIAVIGHAYLLYDEHITHRLLNRLKQAHYRIVTPEMPTTAELDSGIARIAGKAYWTYEEEVVGAAGHYLQTSVDGIIGIMAFGCGPDSVMMDMVRREATRKADTSFMSLTLEEHTAEAGLITRLEAFLDMIFRKKRNGAAVCV